MYHYIIHFIINLHLTYEVAGSYWMQKEEEEEKGVSGDVS